MAENSSLPMILAVDRIDMAGQPDAHLPTGAGQGQRRRAIVDVVVQPAGDDRSNADAMRRWDGRRRWTRSLNTCSVLWRTSMRVCPFMSCRHSTT